MRLKRTLKKKNPKTPEVDSNILSAVFHLEGSLLLTTCRVAWPLPAVCSWAELTPPPPTGWTASAIHLGDCSETLRPPTALHARVLRAREKKPGRCEEESGILRGSVVRAGQGLLEKPS